MLHAICQQIWKTQRWPQDWKRSVFIPIPKKGNAKECSNYHTIELISHADNVMLKILLARLQQYMNWELPDVQAGFRKGRGTRYQIGIKIARRNINNLRYSDDTMLMAESKEELKSLLIKVKDESEKDSLTPNIKKLRSWHLVPSLYANRWGNNGNSETLYFLGLQNHCKLWW